MEMTLAAIEPVTPARWPDLQRLFAQSGVCRGCYCMAWRKPPREYRAGKAGANELALRQRVEAGPAAPGLVAYDAAGEPVGWVAVAPRHEFLTLARSRVWAPVEGVPPGVVWSITCFFLAKPWRGRGLSVELIRAATRFAFAHGACAVEAYPYVPDQRLPDAFLWTGMESAFRAAGYQEVARRSARKPILRCAILPED